MLLFPESAHARSAVAIAAVGFALLGCGGISARDAGTAPSAPRPPRAEPSGLALRFTVPLAEPVSAFDPYSLEPPVLLAFAPDGSRLAFAPNSAAREYDTVTGALLTDATGGPLALARNGAFTLELENDAGALELTALATGAVRWEVPAPPGLLLAAFSDDDRYALALGCSQAGATLERFRVDDGAAEHAIPLGRCLGSRVSFDAPLPTLVVRAHGNEAIVTAVSGDSDPAGALSPSDPNIDAGAAWLVELDGGALTPFDAVATVGARLLAFAGAAGDGGLATLGSDGALTFRSDATSEPAWPAVPASTVKLACYFVPPVVLPLAVSADARLLAAGASDGRALVLRRTSDGAELARAVGAGDAHCDVAGTPPLPLLAAFAGDGALLAVAWDGALAVYDVR
jgi:hypothetical protein